MTVKRVRYTVGLQAVVGALHVPSGAGPHPAVVVAGPMTSVKEQVTGVYANALARRGVAALAIDHRHYGESDGLPRGYEHHGRKIADLLAAVDVLQDDPDVDPSRIGGVGVCLGSGYMAYAAASHPAIRALGFVAGYFRDPRAMRESDPAAFDAKVEQGRNARERYERTGDADVIPAVALDTDAAMQTPDTYDYYARRAAHPNYRNAFAVMSREYFLPFDVQAAAPLLRVPVRLVHARKALSPHWAERFAQQLGDRGELHWVESSGQTAFYDDPSLVDTATDLVADHLHTVFGATRAPG